MVRGKRALPDERDEEERIVAAVDDEPLWNVVVGQVQDVLKDTDAHRRQSQTQEHRDTWIQGTVRAAKDMSKDIFER